MGRWARRSGGGADIPPAACLSTGWATLVWVCRGSAVFDHWTKYARRIAGLGTARRCEVQVVDRRSDDSWKHVVKPAPSHAIAAARRLPTAADGNAPGARVYGGIAHRQGAGRGSRLVGAHRWVSPSSSGRFEYIVERQCNYTADPGQGGPAPPAASWKPSPGSTGGIQGARAFMRDQTASGRHSIQAATFKPGPQAA